VLKFARPITIGLTYNVLLLIVTSRWEVDLYPSALNVCNISAVAWRNSATNLSKIEQSAAELQRFKDWRFRSRLRIGLLDLREVDFHNILRRLPPPLRGLNASARQIST